MNMRKRLIQLSIVTNFFFILVVSFLGCARTTSPPREEALRESSTPSLSDDLPIESFRLALTRQIELFRSGRGPSSYVFGTKQYSRAQYLQILERLLAVANAASSLPELFPLIEQDFQFQEVYGRENWGEVLVTGYYESRLPGSRLPTERYRQALYRRPPELKDGEEFLSREAIDSEMALAGRNLEICYVDPIDATIIQTQGSGIINFEDGSEIKLVFAGKNARKYTPVGKYVRETLKIAHAYFDSVETYLRQLPEPEMRQVLNTNESYVFFEENHFGARTAMGIPATAGRTVAIDPKLFPKGGIGFLTFDRPGGEVGESNRVSRFVIAQDVGSAIQGPARVDLFIGEGEAAKFEAGRLKSQGRLYFLVPKEDSLGERG